MPSRLPNTSLDVAVKVFLGMINIYNQPSFSKADSFHNVGGPFNHLKALTVKIEVSRGRRSSASGLQCRNPTFVSSLIYLIGGFWTQPSTSTLVSVSNLASCPTGFMLANPHDYMSQFFKINLYFNILIFKLL